jgi:hypothetical protein
MDLQQKEERHRALNDLVTLAEAAVTAYLQTAGPATTISEVQRNQMGERLARVLTLYSIAEDRSTVRALSAGELEGGSFVDGARIVTFADGRPSIRNLAVTRTSLKAAVDRLKR